MIHSFLLIGQSNMAGRGFLEEAENIDTSRIKIMRNGRWQDMFRPINPDRYFSGVNLAESFALEYAKKYDVDVGLICCADGGTALNQWMPGEILFENAVNHARLAMRTSNLVGILWHQGETDCSPQLCSTYLSRFDVFIKALRKELNLPDAPFLLGGLGDFLADCPLDENLKNYAQLNDVLKTIAKTIPHTGFVSAEGLSANPDNLHFNAKSLYNFGIRYFDEFEKLNTSPVIPVQSYSEDITRTQMEKL